MAQIKSQIKRIETNEKARLRNQAFHSKVKTQVKKLKLLVSAKDLQKAEAEFIKTVSLIDKAVSKNVLHLNAAARQKRQLQALINTLKA
ncbi:MAG: 30S ribosomal protein S20 [Bacilli bacterium]|jgi:small subunit ribosomal protein S20